MKALTLSLLALVTFASCALVRDTRTNTQPLTTSGNYFVVKAVTDGKGQKVQLHGISNVYYFPTDTLKYGDSVFVSIIRHYSRKN